MHEPAKDRVRKSRIARNEQGFVQIQGWVHKRVADFLRIQRAKTGQTLGEIIEAAAIHYYQSSISIDQTNLLPVGETQVIVDKLAHILEIIEETTGIKPNNGKG